MTDRQTDGRMDGQTDGWTEAIAIKTLFKKSRLICYTSLICEKIHKVWLKNL